MPKRSTSRPAIRRAGLCLAVAALAACKAPTDQPSQTTQPVTSRPAQLSAARQAQPELGLMTSLPILWAEGEVGSLLSGENAGNWVRDRLDERFRPMPLDRLTQLGDQKYLLLAQPRALAGDENVALDDWVRGGGQLLLLADPMLTAHSDYGLGDARAPQPVALVSPILARWGLEMTFDPAQSREEQLSEGPLALPLRMAGRLQLTDAGHESRCKLGENALVARCDVGKGRVTVVADAALVEDIDHPTESSAAAFDRLLDSAFDTTSD